MSAFGDLRDNLLKLHKMLPLTDREATIARMTFDLESGSTAEDIRRDRKWYGENAVEAWNAIALDEDEEIK